MLYNSGEAWRAAPEKRVMLFGMSGLGKTHVSNMLRGAGGWYHYSVDYRIGTRYMGEAIDDNCRAEAMCSPYLRELMLSDAVTIRAKLSIDNLAPLSSYLGKPGNPALGGLPFAEYARRQALHREAEIAAMLDAPAFIERARALYGYPNFVCDTSGSICEVVDPEDDADPVMSALSRHLLPVWIEGTEAHTQALIARAQAAPKPMYYRPEFLEACWRDYLESRGLEEAEVDPDDFVRSTFARALSERRPRYAALARRWGVTVSADEIAALAGPEDFEALIARAIDRKPAAPAGA